jgi:hypothetical protein
MTRPSLDAALCEQVLGGSLQRRWWGEALVLSGRRAQGSIVQELGRLVGRARLGSLARLVHSSIEQQVGKALREAPG